MPAYPMGKMGNCPGPRAQGGPALKKGPALKGAPHLLKGLLKIK